MWMKETLHLCSLYKYIVGMILIISGKRPKSEQSVSFFYFGLHVQREWQGPLLRGASSGNRQAGVGSQLLLAFEHFAKHGMSRCVSGQARLAKLSRSVGWREIRTGVGHDTD